MNRPILRFDTDEAGDFVALLSCGHTQHVRHNPPYTNRPWALTESGRQSRVGAMLDCVDCDAFELPENFVPFERSPVFDETNIPLTLQKEHATKAGIWGKIYVMEGRLRYVVPLQETDMVLSPTQNGYVLPEVRHSVTALGFVKFFIEFLHANDVTA